MFYGSQEGILYSWWNNMDIKLIAVIAILGILLIIVFVKYILHRRQVVNICRQMAFIMENNTNKIICNDITEKEILKLTDFINLMYEEHKKKENILKEKDTRLKTALAGISHDIRTPLTSLKGFFELLENEDNIEKRGKYIQIINKKIIELTELLEELFTYTKLQNEEYILELKEYDFTKIVLGTLFSFYSIFKEENIKTDVDIEEKTAVVLCNDIAVKRILSNIIKNAIIHGNGNARIKYSIKDNSVEFECGNGIINPREIDISQVFDRFYKSDAARGRGSTGLGLPVAKELSDRMGGKISASIEENMFVIKFVMYTRPDVRKT